jgi:hypothetical protein
MSVKIADFGALENPTSASFPALNGSPIVKRPTIAKSLNFKKIGPKKRAPLPMISPADYSKIEIIISKSYIER